MGLVFKARHRRLGRIVAMNILASLVRPRSAARLAGFAGRSTSPFRLSHPNIILVLDADEDRGVHFLTMEYIDGHDLDQLVVAGGSLPVGQAIDCLIQAARGLELADARVIVHRDVKPSNLMLRFRRGCPHARPWPGAVHRGLRPVRTAQRLQPDRDGACMGTVDFMARPEQATDSKCVDHRAERDSLGCSLYFLLTGRPPFRGTTALPTHHLADQELPPPSPARSPGGRSEGAPGDCIRE